MGSEFSKHFFKINKIFIFNIIRFKLISRQRRHTLNMESRNQVKRTCTRGARSPDMGYLRFN